MGSSYRMELDKWICTLDVKAKAVLDIGGSQLPAKGRTKTWDVGEYKIADLDVPHDDSPQPEIILDLNYESELLDSFDLIFCLEVFDYIWNPAQAFETLEDLLEAGGTLWASFPFFYPTHQPIEDDALRYTEFGIRKLAASVNLIVEEVIPRRPQSNAVEFLWRSERMRAAKGYDHNVTGWIVKFRKPA